ncbi:unnamed protein product, partial [marine sediment metagenome]
LPKYEKKDLESIHQLPSFPTDSLGEKFSQNTIKEAVTGKKEGEEVFEADDFALTEDNMRMMQKPLKKPLTKELPSPKKIPEGFEEAAKKVKEAEPIFIRIDKFEESLRVFEKTKKQISEIEKMLRNIKRIKEEEEKELELWENEIQTAKEQIEKVDKDIFSKIE